MALMRFYVRAQRQAGDKEWAVTVHPEALDAPPLAPQRNVRRSGSAPTVYPQPPLDELPALAGAPHAELCGSQTTGVIADTYDRIIGRTADPRRNDVEVFGLYLFATLIGEDVWTAIAARAGQAGGGVELALYWADDERELARLPWEMMRRGGAAPVFLAADPERRVAVTRVVPGTAQTAPVIPLPLKVLFVVGSDLTDERIHAGTEYLGLLQRLEAHSMEQDINHHILLAATQDDVVEEMRTFQPSVVHFICHGQAGSLELRGADGRQPVLYNAQQIAAWLRPDPRLAMPPVVVLNACETAAGTPAGPDTMFPLATEMVVRGVPIVIGMGGEVADDACRLFSRRFYEAILQGSALPEATAEGRRAGILGLGNATVLVDWAFPTLFLAEKTSPQIGAATEAGSPRQRLHSIARKLAEAVPAEPPIFCDRMQFLVDYRNLLNVSHPHKVLVAEVTQGTPARADPTQPQPDAKAQYGKTRLLSELAVSAVRDGHVPVLCQYRSEEQPPVRVQELCLNILWASLIARRDFQLPAPAGSQLLDLLSDDLQALGTAQPADAPNTGTRLIRIRTLVQGLPTDRRLATPTFLIGQALRADLADLAAAARVTFTNAKVIVMIDEVNSFGSSAVSGLFDLLDADGLGQPGDDLHGRPPDPVPVIMTVSNVRGVDTTSATGQTIGRLLDNAARYVVRRTLEPFPDPAIDPWPYRQYLLHRTPRLVVCRGIQRQLVDGALADLHVAAWGVPSWLKPSNFWLNYFLKTNTERLHVFRAADDDELLEAMVRGDTVPIGPC